MYQRMAKKKKSLNNNKNKTKPKSTVVKKFFTGLYVSIHWFMPQVAITAGVGLGQIKAERQELLLGPSFAAVLGTLTSSWSRSGPV